MYYGKSYLTKKTLGGRKNGCALLLMQAILCCGHNRKVCLIESFESTPYITESGRASASNLQVCYSEILFFASQPDLTAIE